MVSHSIQSSPAAAQASADTAAELPFEPEDYSFDAFAYIARYLNANEARNLALVIRIQKVDASNGVVDSVARLGLNSAASVENRMDYYLTAKMAGKEDLAKQIRDQNPALLALENVHIALKDAIQRGLFERVQILCEQDEFNLYLRPDDWVEALDLAEKARCKSIQEKQTTVQKHTECVKILFKRTLRFRNFAAQIAAIHGRREALGYLLKYTQNIQEVVKSAAEFGRVECLKYLLEQDKSVQKAFTLESAQWALYQAQRRGHVECARLLDKWIQEQFPISHLFNRIFC